jgi:hypothetical protein
MDYGRRLRIIGAALCLISILAVATGLYRSSFAVPLYLLLTGVVLVTAQSFKQKDVENASSNVSPISPRILKLASQQLGPLKILGFLLLVAASICAYVYVAFPATKSDSLAQHTIYFLISGGWCLLSIRAMFFPNAVRGDKSKAAGGFDEQD